MIYFPYREETSISVLKGQHSRLSCPPSLALPSHLEGQGWSEPGRETETAREAQGSIAIQDEPRAVFPVTCFSLPRFCGAWSRETTDSTLVSGDSEDGVDLKAVGQKTNGAQNILGQEFGEMYGYLEGPKVAV